MGTTHSPVLGTDGLYHVVYELELTNTKVAPATLRRIDVLDAGAPTHLLASYMDQEIIARLRTLQPKPAQLAAIEPNSSRLLYIELAFRALDEIPRAITHHLYVLGVANPGTSTPTPLDYTVGRISLNHTPLPLLGPPLAGDGWVAVNGCCNSDIIHRGSFQSVNGSLYDAQRFAIDYMRLNAQGELVHGDPSDVHSYVDYGTDVLAVADGTVVATLNNLKDQKPGTLPDPTSITIETVDGNHVVVDIGHGLYAFYAHLQKDSVTVHAGQHVKKGMVLGKLGNSGNTSAPHLHFHLMNGASVLGSDGLPYLINDFTLAGQIDVKAFDESPTLAGNWGQGRLKKAIPQRSRFPLNLNIVNFPK
ncbi:MAG TPA: M23 family metallopeptidase [Nitrospiraceae bacterium]|nr:M23 family metallopeptidase [Nitrospiraceae bacterium]